MKRNRITFAHLYVEVSGNEGIVDLGHDAYHSGMVLDSVHSFACRRQMFMVLQPQYKQDRVPNLIPVLVALIRSSRSSQSSR